MHDIFLKMLLMLMSGSKVIAGVIYLMLSLKLFASEKRFKFIRLIILSFFYIILFVSCSAYSASLYAKAFPYEEIWGYYIEWLVVFPNILLIITIAIYISIYSKLYKKIPGWIIRTAALKTYFLFVTCVPISVAEIYFTLYIFDICFPDNNVFGNFLGYLIYRIGQIIP